MSTENEQMNIFIGWSGSRSKAVATALHKWLTYIFQDVRTWMSEHDIQPGSRWSTALDEQLELAHFGILCLTRDNLTSPWMLFEAGSLAKSVSSSRVVPYRLGVKDTEIEYPLAQFQGVHVDKKGTLKLIQTINNFRDHSLEREKLEDTFNKWWPDLKKDLDQADDHQEATEPIRTERELLEEILQVVRTPNTQPIPSSFQLLSLKQKLPSLSSEAISSIMEVFQEMSQTTKDFDSRAALAEIVDIGRDVLLSRRRLKQKDKWPI